MLEVRVLGDEDGVDAAPSFFRADRPRGRSSSSSTTAGSRSRSRVTTTPRCTAGSGHRCRPPRGQASARGVSDLEELFLQVTARRGRRQPKPPAMGATDESRRRSAADRRWRRLGAVPVERLRVDRHRRRRHQGAAGPDARPARVRRPDASTCCCWPSSRSGSTSTCSARRTDAARQRSPIRVRMASVGGVAAEGRAVGEHRPGHVQRAAGGRDAAGAGPGAGLHDRRDLARAREADPRPAGDHAASARWAWSSASSCSALAYVFLLIIASHPDGQPRVRLRRRGAGGPRARLRCSCSPSPSAWAPSGCSSRRSSSAPRPRPSLTYVVVLVLDRGDLGRAGTVLAATSGGQTHQQRLHPRHRRHQGARQQLLWLNPFVADMDLICATAPGSYGRLPAIHERRSPASRTSALQPACDCPPDRCLTLDARAGPHAGPRGRRLRRPSSRSGVANAAAIGGFAPDGACPPQRRGASSLAAGLRRRARRCRSASRATRSGRRARPRS